MSNIESVKQQALVTNQEMIDDWGVPTTKSQDMVIPKILLQQGMSEATTDGKAQMGDFIDSLTGAKIGSVSEPFQCIPFYCQKTFDIMEEQADGKFEYRGSEPIIEDPMAKGYNDNLPWEDTGLNKDGKKVKIKRVRKISFFVLLPKEINQGGAMPYMFSFKSTGLKEGKKLFTQMYIRNVRAGMPPPAYIVSIGGTRQKNDKGTFMVPNFELGRATTKEELMECKQWISLLKTGAVKIDTTSDLVEAQDLTAEKITFDKDAPAEY